MANVRGMGVAVITSTWGRPLVFLPKLRTLRHAKAVLLIDHHEAKVMKLYLILNQRVCADQDIDLTRLKSFVNLLPLLFPR